MLEPRSDDSDARLLFSSAPQADREPSTDAPAPADTSVSSIPDSNVSEKLTRPHSAVELLCVQIPALTTAQKAAYRSVANNELEPEDEYLQDGLERIVAEADDRASRSYYVRYENGDVYQVPARAIESRHTDLLQSYEKSKSAGTLPVFDPTSADVHPGVRKPTLTFKLPSFGTNSAQRLKQAGTSSSDESAHDVDSDDYSDSLIISTSRRTVRPAAVLANKKLGNVSPLNTRKTRSGRSTIVVHGSDSDSEIQEVTHPTRRSTRAKRTVRGNLDDEDFDDMGFIDDASDVGARPNRKAGKKKIVRGKASRPAYGNFRVVADLDYDEEEDEEFAPLVAHRSICEKCHTGPAHEQLMKVAKKGKRRKKNEDEESEDEETRLTALGGWVRCLKCPVAAHWGCLAKTQRDEILRAALERDKADWLATNPNLPEPRKRLELNTHQTTEFICGSCMKGGICMGCKEVALMPDQFAPSASALEKGMQPAPGEVSSTNGDGPVQVPRTTPPREQDGPRELLFRCFTCKRLSHYAHLPVPDEYEPDDASPVELARYYQHDTGWKCADCNSYVHLVEHILAWRPYPETAVEPLRAPGEPVNVKAMLPREYLVKWVDRSYRRVEWVPHGWLLAMAHTKLKNFLQGGTKVPLLPEPVSEEQLSADGAEPSFDIAGEDTDSTALGAKDEVHISPLVAGPDAERKIPPGWKTVDRVLDILLWRPRKASKGKDKKSRLESDDDNDDSDDPEVAIAREAAYERGEKPPSSTTVTVEEFERLTRQKLSEKHADRVAWAFFKWEDLGYDDASWDSPPRPSERYHAAYHSAFKRFLFARSVTVPSRDKKQNIVKTGMARLMKQKFTTDSQPPLGQSSQFKLMPFQIDGVNWLCHNWSISQNCILADEMGLGKTVQIVSFIGYIASVQNSFPALVVVPNSTITNWVREFERWAPKLRVVPFYGEAKARDIIKRYELFHSNPASGTTGAKYHVLITTYETVTNVKEFTPVFKNTPRWEVLVVDEGQRLKSDSSLIFKRLKELNSFQRIIMTGTPLNNNIRELFNLMNFLDPDEWRDLEQLSKQYEELTDELVKDLHVRLKPYFLRRIKSEVLQLPPKNEVIVPVSMAPLQKEIYRSILSQNLEVLRSLAEGPGTSKGNNSLTKANMNNMLMQLRKCIQHPYLVSETIEPRGLPPQETHDRLVGASAKLRLLKTMLPKLRARGHRVLLFSQFVIALDIVEDFLIGEGIKYLRLDGNTKQADRQKGMDEFNKPDSDVFIYLLTTRAGGVGINLWSADTVIIFDPDFNPHQDLQAIARAHRYGQKKTVLVFKLMVKDSAEERIMQTGKKKLVLDHLIVQKMDDESGSKEDVQSILLFGAKALFEDNEESTAREIHYSEHDIESLIEKTEKEGEEVEAESGAGLFAFAKVWSADKEGLEDLPNDVVENSEEADSWAKALQLIATERAKEREKEVTGRGVRRKAAAVFPHQSLDLGDTPTKDQNQNKSRKRKKSRGKSAGSDDSDFHAPVSDIATESDASVVAMDVDMDDVQLMQPRGSSPPVALPAKHDSKHKAASRRKHADLTGGTTPPVNSRPKASGRQQGDICGLCGKIHLPGQCSMTESPENLAQYRLMLMQHAGDETIEERRAAIRVIDETLHRLGKISLIYGQPLHLVETPPQPTAVPIVAKPKVATQSSHPAGKATANGAQPTAGPSTNGQSHSAKSVLQPSSAAVQIPAAITGISRPLNAVASSSKRPPSPISTKDAPKAKKAKDVSGQLPCVVCGRVPHHLVKDCRVVAKGPSRISEAIQRLSQDPANATVVDVLRKLMIQQQRRALATAPSGSVVYLDDS